MAVDMFIKIGSIKGESEDDKHKGEIDVLAWSWGASNSASSHMGGGAGSGKANFQDISITKHIDKSSTVLHQRVRTLKHFPDATLTVRKAGEKPLEYLILKLEDVAVSSVSTGGSGGEDRLTENVTLNFAKFNLIYTAQEKGGAGAPEVKFGYDIKANKEL